MKMQNEETPYSSVQSKFWKSQKCVALRWYQGWCLFIEDWRKGIKIRLTACNCKNHMTKLICPSLSYQHVMEEPELSILSCVLCTSKDFYFIFQTHLIGEGAIFLSGQVCKKGRPFSHQYFILWWWIFYPVGECSHLATALGGHWNTPQPQAPSTRTWKHFGLNLIHSINLINISTAVHLRALGGGQPDDQLNSPFHLGLGSRLRPALLLEVTKVHRTAGHHVHQGNLVKEKSWESFGWFESPLPPVQGRHHLERQEPEDSKSSSDCKVLPCETDTQGETRLPQWQVATWD